MNYLVELFWSDEDGGYIAVVPDLPGCSAYGATPEAAVHEIGGAIEAWIVACRASGGPFRTDRQGSPRGVTGGRKGLGRATLGPTMPHQRDRHRHSAGRY